jgi:cation:H+ antiporter
LLLNSIIIALSVVGLWVGAIWVVESASNIAKRLGLSELVIGLTVVAIATSAPEFAVTVSAALRGQTSISVGNVVGSNIFNLGFILGLVAIFSGIKTNKSLIVRDGFLLVFTAILLIFFFYDLNLSVIEGIILFSILAIYISTLIIKKEKIEDGVPSGEFNWYDIPKLIIGIAAIITSANFLVDSATDLARVLGVSDWIIGITIVAGGTSVPELATSVVAVYKGKYGISAGNLIGSDLFNMLGVLGVSAILNPLQITQTEFTSLYLMLGSLIVLLFLMRGGWKISRRDGIVLILIAIFRWSFDFIF